MEVDIVHKSPNVVDNNLCRQYTLASRLALKFACRNVPERFLELGRVLSMRYQRLLPNSYLVAPS
jgi:hypothetical protein